MADNQKIPLGNKILIRKGFFVEKEKWRRAQAGLPFEEKIKALVVLQKIAYGWGRKKDVLIWKS